MPLRKGLAHQHSNELNILHRILDVTIIIATLWFCGHAYGVDLGVHYQLAAVIAMVVFMFLAEWHVLYASWRSGSMRAESWAIVSIWLLTCGVLLALSFLSKSSPHFSRVAILAWMVLTPSLLIWERLLLRYALRRVRVLGMNLRSVAIVGGGKSASRLAETITAAPWMGLKIEGIYDDEDAAASGAADGKDVEALLRQVQNRAIDCVYITYPMQQEEKIRSLVERLADSTVSVHVVPDVFISDLFHARWTSVGDVPLVSVYESPMHGSNAFLKRLEDIVLGGIILTLITPLMLAIAAAIKMTSPGPVIFKQRRYGLNGQVIEVWKFRSMTVTEDGEHVPQAQKNDPRVTPLGGFLRRTSLDELPQFINVLQGQMSIVGPRPHAVAHNEQYRKLIHGYMLRHKVKPGITGWAQVNGWRGETDTIAKMEKRVQYDLDYINNWSLSLDLRIIYRTIFGGMRSKNAY